MKTVGILMSTYNGEKYISQQIDSLLNQKGINIEIYVRDDGSKDKTKSIIQEYMKKYPCIHFIQDDKNLGPAGSFMELIYNTPDHDYYAFCDQDDIWKENKVIEAVRQIEEKGCKKPYLYCSNQMLYVDGQETNMRFNHEPQHNLLCVVMHNYISGCTMVMNKQLRDIIIKQESRPSSQTLRMHDTWIMLTANLFGEVIYDNNSYIDYRIHQNNTVGLSNDSFLSKLKQFKKSYKKKKEEKNRSTTAKELLKRFPNMNKEDHDVLSVIAKYDTSISSKFKLLSNKRIRKEAHTNRLILFINVLMNWL